MIFDPFHVNTHFRYSRIALTGIGPGGSFCGESPAPGPLIWRSPLTYWVLILWLASSTEPPIVTPVLFTTEAECRDFGKGINDITKRTVKIDRRFACHAAMVEHTGG